MEPLSLSHSTLSLVSWPDPSVSQSSQLPYHLLLKQSQLFGIRGVFINENHARPSYSYKIVCLYSKIPKYFTRVVLNDCPGWRSYHFDLTWIPFAQQISQWIRPPTQPCLLLYSLWVSFGRSLKMWLIVLSTLLHLLHFVWSCDLSICQLVLLLLELLLSLLVLSLLFCKILFH